MGIPVAFVDAWILANGGLMQRRGGAEGAVVIVLE